MTHWPRCGMGPEEVLKRQFGSSAAVRHGAGGSAEAPVRVECRGAAWDRSKR
ncbi:hypothetical protein BGLT_03460 [Caballeronia glathei]|nr:hypothetical protein BGLT_03460 [Caballeronia glathei]